jgi:energy-coupling factor transporter ATP-binding protein EcfA2
MTRWTKRAVIGGLIVAVVAAPAVRMVVLGLLTPRSSGPVHPFAGPVGFGLLMLSGVPVLVLIGYAVYRLFGPRRHGKGDYATDIRTVEVGAGQDYDPRRHWRPGSGVFLGLSTNPGQPVHVPERLFRERHMQIVGPTGSGKGKLLGNLAGQVIQAGGTLVVIDPKRDRFLPHIVADACAATGRTMHVVDLKERTPGGWHPFKAGRREDRLARIVECFDLAPRGTDADFYKVQGKELLARMVAETDGTISAALAWLEADAAQYQASDKPPGSRERSHFAAWQGRQSLNPRDDGFDLNRALGRGEVIYLRSDPTDPELVIPLKAFLMQVAQWKFARPDTKHLTILADETSLYASTYLAHLLATIRDTGTNIVLAYQSLSDLESASTNAARSTSVACSLGRPSRANDNMSSSVRFISSIVSAIRARSSSSSTDSIRTRSAASGVRRSCPIAPSMRSFSSSIALTRVRKSLNAMISVRTSCGPLSGIATSDSPG